MCREERPRGVNLVARWYSMKTSSGGEIRRFVTGPDGNLPE